MRRTGGHGVEAALVSGVAHGAPGGEAVVNNERGPWRARRRLNMKRWRSLRRNGEFIKWTEPGQVVEGVFLGIEKSDWREIGRVNAEGGPVAFSLTTALAGPLRKVNTGQSVQIQYVGEKMSKAGRMFKDFNVSVLVEDEDPEQEALGIFPSRDDEGHPVDDPGPEPVEADIPY